MKLFEIPMFVTSVFGLGLLSSLDTRAVQADSVFGTPTRIGRGVFLSPSVSTEGLSLYVVPFQEQPGGYGGYDIWAYTRETIHDDWSGPENLGPTINSSYGEGDPDISADGLMLIFTSDWPAGYGSYDLWLTTRTATDEPWSEPENLGPTINGPYEESHASMSADGLSLVFCSDRPGGYGNIDLWVTTRARKDQPWGEPENLGPVVNSPSQCSKPDISSDGLKLFFDSERPGGYGGRDIYLSTRATTNDPWSEPVNLGPIVNSSYNDLHPCISADGSILYFVSARTDPGLRQVPIIPIVDFNGDGKVSGRDVVIMVGCWGQIEPACDIGPRPFGDGTVDEKDLFVLADYLDDYHAQDVTDPTLIAHWPLDETEGMLAFDCAGENYAILGGTPTWQPDAGEIGGAIQCDGVDDVIITKPVPSLNEGPFSIVLWIKGGAPGQAIVAQQGAANWLYLNPADGSLMTGLTGSGQNARPLYSDVVITDDQWHRIGLVWDGARRLLCIDGEEAASDEQDGLLVSGNGLNIGCDCNLAPGSFFSGLIDDVRIYSRAVRP
jgi:hypothetical protein